MDNTNCEIYNCEPCNFSTDRKFNYNQHLKSSKHKENTEFKCERCGNYYKHRQNLYRHRINCKTETPQPIPPPTENSSFVTKDEFYGALNTVVKINSEFQNTILDSNKVLIGEVLNSNSQILESNTKIVETNSKVVESNMKAAESNIEVSKTNSQLVESNTQIQTSLINNNKMALENIVNAYVAIEKTRTKQKDKFNLENYLNNTCKNAINIEDFVKNINPKYEDIVFVGQNGYIEGNAGVIIKYLNELDQKDRPIQCSDAKRHTVYLKSGNKWEKDTVELSKITNAVNKICNRIYRNKKLWTEMHPDYEDEESDEGKQYMIIMKSMSGGGRNIDTIEPTISKRVINHCCVAKH